MFLVDDHMVLHEGLKTLIAAQADLAVLGEAGDGETALLGLSVKTVETYSTGRALWRSWG